MENQTPRIIKHVKVGNDTFPASQEDVEDIKSQLAKVFASKGKLALVTHHAIEVTDFQLPAKPEGVVLVKVGNDSFPASQEDIADTQELLMDIAKAEESPIWVVSHHVLEFESVTIPSYIAVAN
jgi:hypothetical protein